MTLRRRILDYSFAAVLLLLPVVLLHSGLRSPEEQNGFDRAVLRVSSPLQSAVSWVVEGVGGMWQRYVAVSGAEDENRELRRENERLRVENAALARRVADTGELEEFIKLRRRTRAETASARVVAAGLSAYFRVQRIKIDRGEGVVAVGHPVINHGGLVGRVQAVYGDYSDVLLVTDPQSSVAVVVPRTGARGVLTGTGRGDSYRCKIEMLERGAAVEVGDELVTSGLRTGLLGGVAVAGRFPAGLSVGVITSVSSVEYEMFQEVEVEPAVDFSQLDNVLVLVAPSPAPDERGGELTSAASPQGVTIF